MCIYAVSHHYISATQYGVISDNLVENCSVNLYSRLLTFDDNKRLSIAAHCNNVCALSHTVDIHRILLHDKLLCKATVGYHICYNMSTHPLLGSKHNPSSAKCIKYFGASRHAVASAKVYGWIV